MISDLDSYKVAKLMIVRHGADASVIASSRAEALRDAGDPEGLSDWEHILQVIRGIVEPVFVTMPHANAEIH